MSEFVKVVCHDEITEVSFNCPETFNAFDLDMITAMADHLTRLSVDPAVRGVMIAGLPRAFCTGGNLKWVKGYSPGDPGASFHTLAAQLHRAVVEIRRMEKPVAAALTGISAGAGFSLALACDFRVMEKSAVLRQAYTSNGLCIDGGGTFMLPRLVGLARSLEISTFDEPISAEKALEWGLATKLAEDGKGKEAAIDLLRKAAGGSLNAFAEAKRLFNDSFSNSLEFQLELERKGLSACGRHPDGREGISAFMEKRKPDFKKST